MRTSIVGLLLLGAAAVGCHRPRHYEATVEVERLSAVHRDETGRVVASDVEISYVNCPGDQDEVIRGGPEFSECVSKLKVGDRVTVKIVHTWDPEGHYDHDVYEVQGCKRPPDPNDEASFKMVRQCSDWVVNGARVGFQCDYSEQRELVKQCPWFRRH